MSSGAAAAATVRVAGPPNSGFLVGYPGISATLVQLPLLQPPWLCVTRCFDV